LELYQATFEPRWYQAARELAETMIVHFQASDGGFFDTSDDHEPLITRPRDLQDNAPLRATPWRPRLSSSWPGWPSSHVTPSWQERAWPALAVPGRYPLGFGQWLVALDYALSRPRRSPSSAGRRRRRPGLAARRAGGFRPHQVVAMGEPGQEVAAVPLLADRPA